MVTVQFYSQVITLVVLSHSLHGHFASARETRPSTDRQTFAFLFWSGFPVGCQASRRKLSSMASNEQHSMSKNLAKRIYNFRCYEKQTKKKHLGLCCFCGDSPPHPIPPLFWRRVHTQEKVTWSAGHLLLCLSRECWTFHLSQAASADWLGGRCSTPLGARKQGKSGRECIEFHFYRWGSQHSACKSRAQRNFFGEKIFAIISGFRANPQVLPVSL